MNSQYCTLFTKMTQHWCNVVIPRISRRHCKFDAMRLQRCINVAITTSMVWWVVITLFNVQATLAQYFEFDVL